MQCNINSTKSQGTATLRWELSVRSCLWHNYRDPVHMRRLSQHDAIYKYHMCNMNLEIKGKPLHGKWGAQIQVI